MMIRACTSPSPSPPPMLPRRLARARRVMESKRMDTLKELHESLKKTAKKEQEFFSDLFDKILPPEEDEENPKENNSEE